MPHPHDPEKHAILANLHNLNKDEFEALNGYEVFLSKWGNSLTPQQLATINGIIAEEKKHVLEVNEIIFQFDGIKPESEHYPGQSKMVSGGPATDKPKTLSQP